MARSKTVEPRVEKLLKDNQEYRDSDKKLLLKFWETEGLELTPAQKEVFMYCTPAESITRARRHLRGLYPASKKINDARYERFREESSDHQRKLPRAISWLRGE